MPGVQSVTVLLSEDEFPIRGFIISDGRSNTVEIEIRDIKTNTGIKDAVFDLNLPKGVSIYEQHS
jgi:outer membrane lipoprotein-sorting protein